MRGQAKRFKNPSTLGEPFRSFRLLELQIERSRAAYCYFQHKIQGRSLRNIAKEAGMSYERIRQLVERGGLIYGLNPSNYTPRFMYELDCEVASEGCIEK